jgi:hypothetical protein
MPVKPSESEEEYFARQEFERRKAALAQAKPAEEAAARQRALDVAKERCPKCGAQLVQLKFREVEIDKCSNCAGIWLDAGELERITTDERNFLGGLKRIFGT